MKLLREIKGDEFGDLGLQASAQGLSYRLLIPIQAFLEANKILAKY